MKINLYGTGFEDFDIDSCFEGVTNLDAKHTGKYSVKEIHSVIVGSGDTLLVRCELKADDPHLTAPKTTEKPELVLVGSEVSDDE